jgi:hypothetical protein
MKKLFALATFVFALSLSAACAAEKNPLLAAGQVVWAGVDYSQVRLIGLAEEFHDPAVIRFEEWNKLFLDERIPIVEKLTGKQVVADADYLTTNCQVPAGAQLITTPGADDTISRTHLTPDKLAALVKGYDLKTKSGLGLVFIVDRLVKVNTKGEGAVYVVAFDLATRDVVFSERVVGRGDGHGFRNYWFRIVKDGEQALSKLR